MNGAVLCDGDFSVCVCQKVCQGGACDPSALNLIGSFLPQTLNCELPGYKEPCIHIPSGASFLRENKKAQIQVIPSLWQLRLQLRVHI